MKIIKISDYKNLIRTVAVTDFKLRYEGSVLGYLWSLMKPLLLFGVYYVVFAYVFNIGRGIPNYPVYLLLGIMLWSFFLEGTQTLMGSIAGKRDLIRKIYFPRIVLPIANSFTSVMLLCANIVVVVIFLYMNGLTLTFRALLLPLVFLELYIFVLGLGLFLAALFVRFRDIAHIWEILMQALFYATPLLYSPLQVPILIRKFQILSPIAQIIQDARWILVTSETATAWKILNFPYFLIPYVIPVIMLVIGYSFFERSASRFAEEV
jgi:ABC-2 type transport system permease protein